MSFVVPGHAASQADLSIRLSTVTWVVGGSNTTFVSVTNRGPLPTDGPIVVTHELPGGVGFISGEGDGFTCAVRDGALRCTRSAALDVGYSATVAIEFRVCLEAAPSVTYSAILEYAGDRTDLNNRAKRTTSVRIGRDPVTGCGPDPSASVVAATAVVTATPTPTASPTPTPEVEDLSTPSRIPTPTRTRPVPPKSPRPGPSPRSTRFPIGPGRPRPFRTRESRTPTPTVHPNVVRTDLQLDTVVPEGFRAGAAGAYVVSVFNYGGVATNAPITVTDTLAEQLVVINIDAPQWSCRQTAQTVTCTRSAPLADYESTSITINVFVPESAFPMVSNTAELAYVGDTVSRNNREERSTTVRAMRATR